MKTNIEKAFLELEESLGKDKVIKNEDIVNFYKSSTIPISKKILGVLFPINVSEIQKILRIANKFKISIYTISKGKNIGYGSRCPVKDNCIIVDLQNMNKIIEVNTKLAYAVIEPGVTQKQLYEYLKNNNIPLCIDVTGAPPDASILGNILERGFGHTSYGDHFLHSCGMEVVLANGNILRTGFGHFKNSKTWHVFKWGVGPYLDGIFTQSNFGIVTKMGIWLRPIPEKFDTFFLKIASEENLYKIVDRLRELKMDGIIQSCVHIGNDLRIISHLYNTISENFTFPLREEIIKELRKKYKLTPWSGSGAIYGTKEHNRLIKKVVKKQLKKLASIYFISEIQLKFLNKLANLIKKRKPEIKASIDMLQEVYNLMQGVPSETFIYGTYWRKNKKVFYKRNDPDKDQCGLIWHSPVIPATGEDVKNLIKIIKPIFNRYGFEMIISMTLINERALDCVIAISFDKENNDESYRALSCYEALLDVSMKEGYLPYRLGIHAMERIIDPEDTYWQVVKQIKRALDPNEILSPGRYCY